MISVCIIDDSAFVRKFISRVIGKTHDIVLTVKASSPILAIKRIKKNNVDVIILDIEMPGMNGLKFLKEIRFLSSISVIIFSSMKNITSDTTMYKYECAAFDILKKPENETDITFLEDNIIKTIRRAAVTNIHSKSLYRLRKYSDKKYSEYNSQKLILSKKNEIAKGLIVIGSSTGGTAALFSILSGLSFCVPGIVVVQHMPTYYMGAFADRLNSIIPITVKIAEEDESIHSQTVYLAPGNAHCTIMRKAGEYAIKLVNGPRVNYHKPSITMLFDSVANIVGSNAIGIMLSGMGEDGAIAMCRMKEAGCYNIIQDEQTSVVWGMPGKVHEYGGEDIILPDKEIAREIYRILYRK